MDPSAILFYVLAIILIGLSFKTITSDNPIHCALYLACTMVTLAFMFFTLGAPFIAAVQLIVYAGAVMVLFVMVLMLFDLRKEIRAFAQGKVTGVLKIASAGLLCGFIALVMVVSTDLFGTNQIDALKAPATSTKELSHLLFSKYIFAFEALGVLLLLVAVGAVAVSRTKGGTHARD